MNRADLSFALNAVLPHAGTPVHGDDVVGFTFRDGVTYAFATDRYTIGIARIREMPAAWNFFMPKNEATELMRFIRPSRKDEKIEEVFYNDTRPGELHIATGDEAEAFDTRNEVPAWVQYDFLVDSLIRLQTTPLEFDECIYQPDLVAKFAKAKRVDSDRLRILPRHASNKRGVAVVSVGDDFIGAISGLTYDELGTSMVDEFLGIERKVA